MQASGLKIKSGEGDFKVHPIQAVELPANIEPVDLVIVAVKTWQVPEAAQAIGPLLSPEGFVLPLENGVDAPDQLAEVLGKDRVLGGLCVVQAFISAPGEITNRIKGGYVTLGELDNRPSDRTQRLLEIFQRAGVDAEIPQDIQVAMWYKFLRIANLGGVGAVARAPLGVTLNVRETRLLLRAGMEEVYAVGKARGVNLPGDIVDQGMAALDGMPATTIASMHRDIVEGRPSELENQVGTVVRLGEVLGVDTPTHRFLYASLLPLEMRARGKVEF
jgi:2-dehydropantoate 2-reductase